MDLEKKKRKAQSRDTSITQKREGKKKPTLTCAAECHESY